MGMLDLEMEALRFSVKQVAKPFNVAPESGQHDPRTNISKGTYGV